MSTIEERNEVLQMIKKLSYYFEKIKNRLCLPYGLSAVQSTVLLDIYHHNSTKVTDICERLNKSTNTISPIINRLESLDFIHKIKNNDDARVVEIHLSEKSQVIMRDLMKDIEDFTWPMFDSVTDEEFSKIYSSLKLLEEICK